jgi:hypothetical protein
VNSRRAAIAIVLALVAAAGASGREPLPEAEPTPCFERAVVVLYLHRLQDRILDHWVLPPDGLANHSVTLRLRLDETGVLLSYELVSRTSSRLEISALRAVAASAPFEPMTEETACLTERAIVSEFSNPS